MGSAVSCVSQMMQAHRDEDEAAGQQPFQFDQAMNEALTVVAEHELRGLDSSGTSSATIDSTLASVGALPTANTSTDMGHDAADDDDDDDDDDYDDDEGDGVDHLVGDSDDSEEDALVFEENEDVHGKEGVRHRSGGGNSQHQHSSSGARRRTSGSAQQDPADAFDVD